MQKIKPNEIETHPFFVELFPIQPKLLEKIETDMTEGTYDLSQPVILATWNGQETPVCIDGHTRLKAAINAGIDELPVWTHEFDTEEEAIEKAIKLQQNRRNMSDRHSGMYRPAGFKANSWGRPKKPASKIKTAK